VIDSIKPNDTNIGERQRELAAGVLNQAARDLRRFHGATSELGRELYVDAYSWVKSHDDSWPFSFLNVCHQLNREPNELRQELLGELSFGLFGRWSRRCTHAARRLAESVVRTFGTEDNQSTTAPGRLLETWH